MLNEYKKTWAKRAAVREAPPIRDELLRAMVATCDLRAAAGHRDRCVLLLGRGALYRRIGSSGSPLTPHTPGPPKLRTSEPMRRAFGPVALRRIRATSIVLLSGFR
ncbi:hypothetical protein [Streptomyces atroolivaceus]|uniref:hypothetical protein n=1 Tax=Streptomyces atroolivaceus TaxID=66869 RepID=UPI003F4CC3CD